MVFSQFDIFCIHVYPINLKSRERINLLGFFPSVSSVLSVVEILSQAF